VQFLSQFYQFSLGL